MKRRAWVLTLIGACACGGAGAGATGAGGTGGATGGSGQAGTSVGGTSGTGGTGGAAGAAGSSGGAPVGAGMQTLPGCAGIGVGDEVCSYSWVYDTAACANRGCRKLVIYFSGGQESCPALDDPNSYLAYYKARGYVAACAMAFQTSDGSAQFPRNKEAPRFDALVKAITSDPGVRAGWNGDYLLFSGVSHGASGPVVTMATSTDDEQPAWQGAVYTAACFNDGTYDAAALLGFGFTNQCRDATAVVPYSRNYGRYCTWPTTANGNVAATWPDPGTCATADSAADTIADGDVTRFAIHDWRLAECGSALDPCTRDVLPAGPIQALCSRIAAAPGYGCAFESFPDTGHISCGIDAATIGSCDAWFEARLAARGLN